MQVLDEEDGQSDPNLYIMLNDSLPTLSAHDLRCSFYGEDLCVVSGKEIEAKNATKITVGVFCRKECKFRV